MTKQRKAEGDGNPHVEILLYPLRHSATTGCEHAQGHSCMRKHLLRVSMCVRPATIRLATVNESNYDTDSRR